jgi:beta-xylosidase
MKEIWSGWKKFDSEGPHLYKKDGWYYLLISKGGTFENHLLSIARAKDIWRPYESCPQNPILSAEGREKDDLIQHVGHGELIRDMEGRWWAIVLGIRCENGRYPLGRETFLCPVA